MRELLGIGYHYCVHRVKNPDVVIKFSRLPFLRTRENELGEATYQKTRSDVTLLEKYLGRQHCLETRVRTGPYGLWWIQQEKLLANTRRVNSRTLTDLDDLQIIATKASLMTQETGYFLDWFGLESLLNPWVITTVFSDPRYWELPNLRLVPDGGKGHGKIKIVDTGLLLADFPPLSKLNNLPPYHEPLFVMIQQQALTIVEERSGIRF